MIDFRYHIVSIVSIFLALAVGIVLGAGPLQNEIGSTLQSEIAGLREDKAQLNDNLSLARTQAEEQGSYLAAVADRVVADTLSSRRVAVLVLPGADGAVSEAVVEALGAAGATLTSTTSLSADWVSAEVGVAAARDAVVNEVASAVGTGGAAPGGRAPRDLLLATLLARTAVAGDSGPSDADARTGLESLSEAGLLSLDTEVFARAELVVVVAGTVTDGDENARAQAAGRWVDLISALGDRSRGTVLAADSATDTAEAGVPVLTTFREDSSALDAVSSIDNAGGPMGVASVVFALDQLDGGENGQYGLDAGADAPYAPVPAS